MATITPNLTNFEFANKTGMHFTMASRLRNGERQPSLTTFIRVVREFALSPAQTFEWLQAIEKSADASGAWLRDNLFGS